MQIAAFSLAEVTYAVGGDIGFQIQESVKQARFRVRTKQENVSGVFLPQFESYTKDENNDFGLTGLGKGGNRYRDVERPILEQWRRSLSLLAYRYTNTLVISTLNSDGKQTAFVILDEVIKVVNRRGELAFSVLVQLY